MNAWRKGTHDVIFVYFGLKANWSENFLLLSFKIKLFHGHYLLFPQIINFNFRIQVLQKAHLVFIIHRLHLSHAQFLISRWILAIFLMFENVWPLFYFHINELLKMSSGLFVDIRLSFQSTCSLWNLFQSYKVIIHFLHLHLDIILFCWYIVQLRRTSRFLNCWRWRRILRLSCFLIGICRLQSIPTLLVLLVVNDNNVVFICLSKVKGLIPILHYLRYVHLLYFQNVLMHELEKLSELRNCLFKFHSIKVLVDHQLVEDLDDCVVCRFMMERGHDWYNLLAWTLVNRLVSEAFFYACDAVASKVNNFGQQGDSGLFVT